MPVISAFCRSSPRALKGTATAENHKSKSGADVASTASGGDVCPSARCLVSAPEIHEEISEEIHEEIREEISGRSLTYEAAIAQPAALCTSQ
ncbi:unnamed protein product [Pleuronectes platessa]|uniref:Uncharacterized protein n=1 Tax=Pleuronectes platessa TaxID=8262 RepID=A0A9N7VD07_PLEPL|nr:unnamed protein product [Pleuronectes platessa]